MKTYLTKLLAGLSLLVVCGISSPALAASESKAKTCVVTGNELGSMGPVVTKNHEGKKVKFCCKPCVAKFNKNPDKYLPAK